MSGANREGLRWLAIAAPQLAVAGLVGGWNGLVLAGLIACGSLVRGEVSIPQRHLKLEIAGCVTIAATYGISLLLGSSVPLLVVVLMVFSFIGSLACAVGGGDALAGAMLVQKGHNQQPA